MISACRSKRLVRLGCGSVGLFIVQAATGFQSGRALAEPRTTPTQSSSPSSKSRDLRCHSALALFAAYAAVGTWMWFAWYADKPSQPRWKFGGDGWFGPSTYAGGADKVGHAWSSWTLSRLGASALSQGNWDPFGASVLATSLSSTLLVLVEVNDGYYTEFSPGDLTADLVGGLAAIAALNVPWLDEGFDFRVQWLPSSQFRRHPGLNFAEDYSGQSYVVALKPGAIPAVQQSNSWWYWASFINPVVGYRATTQETSGAPVRMRQLFLGLSLDLQAVWDVSLERNRGRGSAWLPVGHQLFEYVGIPGSTAPIAGWSHRRALPAKATPPY